MPRSVRTTSTSLHSSLLSAAGSFDRAGEPRAAGDPAFFFFSFLVGFGTFRPWRRSASSPFSQLGAWSRMVSSSSMTSSSLSIGSSCRRRRSSLRSGDTRYPRMAYTPSRKPVKNVTRLVVTMTEGFESLMLANWIGV